MTTRHSVMTFASALVMIAGSAVACPPESDPAQSPDTAKAPAKSPERVTVTNKELRKDDSLKSEKELAQKKFVAQRDIATIRHRHFTGVKNEAVRAQGMEKLRALAADSANLPIILETFSNEDLSTRKSLIDMFASLNTQATDSTVAWVALTEPYAELKNYAMDRVKARTEANKGEAPIGVQYVVAAGLDSSDNKRVGSAANMALTLKLYDAIPMMISAQVRSNQAGVGNNALAQIVIATQRAFVSDLTPIVAEGAVAFDPTISVVTEGVVLRVMDAYVLTYHTEVHNSLVGLAEQGMPGAKVATMGYDQAKWMKWYNEQFLPYREGVKPKSAPAEKKPEIASSGPSATL